MCCDVLCATVRCGAVRWGAVQCGAVWGGAVRCGVVWCGVVWCGVAKCGVMWCGVVRVCIHVRVLTRVRVFVGVGGESDGNVQMCVRGVATSNIIPAIPAPSMLAVRPNHLSSHPPTHPPTHHVVTILDSAGKVKWCNVLSTLG